MQLRESNFVPLCLKILKSKRKTKDLTKGYKICERNKMVCTLNYKEEMESKIREEYKKSKEEQKKKMRVQDVKREESHKKIDMNSPRMRKTEQ